MDYPKLDSKKHWKNLLDILKYSDNEPLELCVALTRLTIFPISSYFCPYTTWWLILFGLFTGVYQIWAV